VCVYRKGQAKPTTGQAKYRDYATGPMWKKFPSTMVAKCAEMLALRKAFPGKLGGLYGAEEMDQAGGAKFARSSRTPGTDQAEASKHMATAPGDVPAPQVTNSWEKLIAAARDLMELQDLGKQLAAQHMGVDEKLALSALYKARKMELVGAQ